MKDAFRGKIDVRQFIPVRKAERLFVQKLRRALQTPANLSVFNRVNQSDLPRLDVLVMHMHLISILVERYVGLVQEVICKVFLDEVSLVTKANDKIVNFVARINLQNMPKHRFPAHFDHWFWSHAIFFTQPGTQTTGKDHRFQREGLGI